MFVRVIVDGVLGVTVDVLIGHDEVLVFYVDIFVVIFCIWRCTLYICDVLCGSRGWLLWTEHPHRSHICHHIMAQSVARRVCIKHVHPHVTTCLSVCCFLVLSSSSVSRASTFSLTYTHPQNEEYCSVAIHNPLISKL